MASLLHKIKSAVNPVNQEGASLPPVASTDFAFRSGQARFPCPYRSLIRLSPPPPLL